MDSLTRQEENRVNKYDKDILTRSTGMMQQLINDYGGVHQFVEELEDIRNNKPEKKSGKKKGAKKLEDDEETSVAGADGKPLTVKKLKEDLHANQILILKDLSTFSSVTLSETFNALNLFSQLRTLHDKVTDVGFKEEIKRMFAIFADVFCGVDCVKPSDGEDWGDQFARPVIYVETIKEDARFADLETNPATKDLLREAFYKTLQIVAKHYVMFEYAYPIFHDMQKGAIPREEIIEHFRNFRAVLIVYFPVCKDQLIFIDNHPPLKCKSSQRLQMRCTEIMTIYQDILREIKQKEPEKVIETKDFMAALKSAVDIYVDHRGIRPLLLEKVAQNQLLEKVEQNQS